MEKTSTKTAKKTPLFVCETCDFKCYKQSDYDRHVVTIKHERLLKTSKKTPNVNSITYVCICGNK